MEGCYSVGASPPCKFKRIDLSKFFVSDILFKLYLIPHSNNLSVFKAAVELCLRVVVKCINLETVKKLTGRDFHISQAPHVANGCL